MHQVSDVEGDLPVTVVAAWNALPVMPGAVAAPPRSSASRPVDTDPLLSRLADHLATLTGGAGWVVRVDEAAGSWVVVAGDGTVPDDVVARLLASGDPVLDGAVLAVPVRRGPRIVGACLATAGRDGGFSDADVHLA